MTIFFYLYDSYFESNRNFTTEHVKTVKIQGFSKFFSDFRTKLQIIFQNFSNSRIFCLNCQIPGFQVKWQP